MRQSMQGFVCWAIATSLGLFAVVASGGEVVATATGGWFATDTRRVKDTTLSGGRIVGGATNIVLQSSPNAWGASEGTRAYITWQCPPQNWGFVAMGTTESEVTWTPEALYGTMTLSYSSGSVATSTCFAVLQQFSVGDNVSAYLGGDGVCTITGAGLVTNTAALKATGGVTNLVVASGVTGIGANVFDGWSSIRDVSLGADCTNIASQAFLECRNLTNVTCAATASMTIGNHAFYWCNSLESMSFGAVPTFGEQAYTLQSGIYIKDGMPEIYPIPQISAPGYRLALMGSVDLQSWTEIKTEVEKLDYNFFKLKLEPSGK